MSRRDAYTRADIERLVQMIKDGEQVPAIAVALDRSEHSVRVKVARIRHLFDLPRGGGRPLLLPISIPGVVMQALHLQADARGVPPPILAAQLLTIIVKDDLFKAVLGDDDTGGGVLT
ncbi:MAG: hypothetical protein J2P55_00220 [Rhizobiales bacterium]|nr:hypothetical protein [Hyphomicrobiales bacterium]